MTWTIFSSVVMMRVVFGMISSIFGLMHVCGLMHVRCKEASVVIEEFLLFSPFGEKGRFLWMARLCSTLWVL